MLKREQAWAIVNALANHDPYRAVMVVSHGAQERASVSDSEQEFALVRGTAH